MKLMPRHRKVLSVILRWADSFVGAACTNILVQASGLSGAPECAAELKRAGLVEWHQGRRYGISGYRITEKGRAKIPAPPAQ